MGTAHSKGGVPRPPSAVDAPSSSSSADKNAPAALAEAAAADAALEASLQANNLPMGSTASESGAAAAPAADAPPTDAVPPNETEIAVADFHQWTTFNPALLPNYIKHALDRTVYGAQRDTDEMLKKVMDGIKPNPAPRRAKKKGLKGALEGFMASVLEGIAFGIAKLLIFAIVAVPVILVGY